MWESIKRTIWAIGRISGYERGHFYSTRYQVGQARIFHKWWDDEGSSHMDLVDQPNGYEVENLMEKMDEEAIHDFL
jgi:hypothetical protein